MLTPLMTKEQGNILTIDDSHSDAREIESVFRAEGYEVETTEAGLARARAENFDVVLTGLHLSKSDESRKDGLSIISQLQTTTPFMAVIQQGRAAGHSWPLAPTILAPRAGRRSI